MLSSIWTNLGPLTHTLTWFQQQLDTKMGLLCNHRLERLWNRKASAHLGGNSLKHLEMQKFIVCMNLYMKSELTEKLVRRMISRICASTKTRWNTLRIENQIKSLKCNAKKRLMKKRCTS